MTNYHKLFSFHIWTVNTHFSTWSIIERHIVKILFLSLFLEQVNKYFRKLPIIAYMEAFRKFLYLHSKTLFHSLDSRAVLKNSNFMKLLFFKREWKPGADPFSWFLGSDKRLTEFYSELSTECNGLLNNPLVKHFPQIYFFPTIYCKNSCLSLIKILYIELCHRCSLSQGFVFGFL